MSRWRVQLDGERVVVLGHDRPLRTWFAQLWDRGFDSDFEWGAPAKAVGYHDIEKVPPLAREYGPYPVVSLDALLAFMAQEWKVTLPEPVVARVRRADARGLR